MTVRGRIYVVVLLFLLTLPFFPIANSLAAESSDTTGPTLTGFSFSPSSLDTTNGPADLTVTIEATDDLSGLRSSEFWALVVFKPHASSGIGNTISDPASTTTIVQFHEYSRVGMWHVAFVELADNANNVRIYTEADLQALGFPTTLRLTRHQDFADVPETYPYYPQIDAVVTAGIATGYGNGLFGPDDLVKRQQFAKMIVRTLDLPVFGTDVCPFTDVASGMDPNDFLYPNNYIAVCAAYGITLGKTATTFAPYDNLSRAQLITMVARAANLPEPPSDYAPVFANFSDTHYPWARKAAYAGLLEGLQGMGSDYAFFNTASRGEVCVMLYNLLQR